jgi:hypothetical protein
MTKWEHAVLHRRVDLTGENKPPTWTVYGQEAEDILDSWHDHVGDVGRAGWEMVGVRDSGGGLALYFKRPLADGGEIWT